MESNARKEMHEQNRRSRQLRIKATTFAESLEAYKLAPMEGVISNLSSKSEQLALQKMLKHAKTQAEYYIVYVEARGRFADIAAKAAAHLTDEQYRPDL